MKILDVKKVSFVVVETDQGTFRVWNSGAVGEFNYESNDWSKVPENKYSESVISQILTAAKELNNDI